MSVPASVAEIRTLGMLRRMPRRVAGRRTVLYAAAICVRARGDKRPPDRPVHDSETFRTPLLTSKRTIRMSDEGDGGTNVGGAATM